MPEWTHLIRFVAVEDDQIHLGQLADPLRDVGLDSVNGVEIKAYLINGDVFSGRVTEHIYTVKKVNIPPLSQITLSPTYKFYAAPFPSYTRTVQLYPMFGAQL
jgi:hypothetical protein